MRTFIDSTPSLNTEERGQHDSPQRNRRLTGKNIEQQHRKHEHGDNRREARCQWAGPVAGEVQTDEIRARAMNETMTRRYCRGRARNVWICGGWREGRPDRDARGEEPPENARRHEDGAGE